MTVLVVGHLSRFALKSEKATHFEVFILNKTTWCFENYIIYIKYC